MNRGSERFSGIRDKEPESSMRPRFMNRGSASATSVRGGRGTIFNEAPIHESGKLLPDVTGIRGRNVFNEAPIHESGKSVDRC